VRVLSLFAGIGGFDLGLERAGMKTVAFCEIDPFCRQVLAKHWPEVPCYDDVRTLTADSLTRAGIHVDAICGGFPCQDISLAGGGAGIEGARSGLWGEYFRLIGEIRPSVVIVENVSALLGRGIGRVLGDLATIRYDAEWHCIPASYAGARQLRDRVWIVAYPERHPLQGGASFTAAWCEKSRAEQLARLVQPRAWPTLSSARDSGTGHGVPFGTHRNRAIGNAVDPRVAQMIGDVVVEVFWPAAEQRAAA
jgi:DNA (cytosine-5)-methyltransferase 1